LSWKKKLINKRSKQIDLEGELHKVNGVQILSHVRYGYNHDEYGGTHALSSEDMKIVEKTVKSCYSRKRNRIVVYE